MSRRDVGSASWVCENIKHGDLLSSQVVGENLIEVTVKNIPSPVKVAVISVQRVTEADIDEVTQDNSVEFVLNVPGGAIFLGEAIQCAINKNVGIGGVGDFYVAMNETEFRGYVDKKMRFTLRGLRQHTAVSNVVQLNDRLLEIQRHTGRTVTVLVLHDYDVSADAVRSGIDKYGAADFILIANPNANVSGSASVASEGLRVPVLKWRNLLGALNN